MDSAIQFSGTRIVLTMIAIACMIGLPLIAAAIARRRLGVGWRYFGYGALIFFLFQLISRVPLVIALQALLAPQLRSSAVFAVLFGLGLALSAGVFEEVGRYIGYRWLMRHDRKTWAKGVMYGLGHGGLESILLVGGLALIQFIGLLLLPATALDALSPEQRAQALQQLAAVAAQPDWLSLVGAWERFWAIGFHVAMSILVLQVFVRGRMAWLWLAIAAHTLTNSLIVLVPLAGLGQYASLALIEGGVALAGAIGLWGAWRLRGTDERQTGDRGQEQGGWERPEGRDPGERGSRGTGEQETGDRSRMVGDGLKAVVRGGGGAGDQETRRSGDQETRRLGGNVAAGGEGDWPDQGNSIETHGLTRMFGERSAVDGLTLAIPMGAVFGFLGPNGAGKTTTVRMLAALIAPTSGEAQVGGHRLGVENESIRRSVGILTETPGLYDRLSARENLVFFARLYDVPRGRAEQQAERYLRILGLSERRDDSVGGFSKGMRQKLAIARALLHEPPVVFLDEPTAGLDPEAARTVRDFIKELRSAGRTIFLTTHNLAEADELCDLIGIFRRRLLRLDSPDRLRAGLFGTGTIVRLVGDAAVAAAVAQPLPFVRAVEVSDETLSVRLDDPEAQNPLLVRALVEAGVQVRYVEPLAHSLEDVYDRVIGDG